MSWTIATDEDPQNPNPHHLTLSVDRYETEAEALAAGAALDAEETVEDWRGHWTVIYVPDRMEEA
jgi:hypothetical protein